MMIKTAKNKDVVWQWWDKKHQCRWGDGDQWCIDKRGQKERVQVQIDTWRYSYVTEVDLELSWTLLLLLLILNLPLYLSGCWTRGRLMVGRQQTMECLDAHCLEQDNLSSRDRYRVRGPFRFNTLIREPRLIALSLPLFNLCRWLNSGRHISRRPRDVTTLETVWLHIEILQRDQTTLACVCVFSLVGCPTKA